MKKNINSNKGFTTFSLHERGFTLVELLVVISIIAILSVVGLTLFNGAQNNARDARRKSDIDAIAAALEAKRQPGSVYYLPLIATDFSSGAIPVDSTTAQYCIKTYTADDGAKTDATVIAGTSFTADANGANSGGICPTGYFLAGVSNGFQPLAANVPFANASATADKKSWKICTKLENTSSAAGQGFGVGAYCRNSSQ